MITEKERKLIQISRKLESQKCRDDMIFFGETMIRAQTALKEDYGLETSMRRQYGLNPEGCPAERRAEGAV
jgi:hypothetical protein